MALNSMGWGGKLKRYGHSETPASKSTVMSGVSTSVHMERTPKLSAANGVTLILLIGSAFFFMIFTLLETFSRRGLMAGQHV